MASPQAISDVVGVTLGPQKIRMSKEIIRSARRILADRASLSRQQAEFANSIVAACQGDLG